MSHHINDKGEFQSDKYPDLPPDKIIISFKHSQTWRGLALIAKDYDATDPDLAADIRTRLASIREQ